LTELVNGIRRIKKLEEKVKVEKANSINTLYLFVRELKPYKRKSKTTQAVKDALL
jgi:hypothetical protein